MRQLSINRRMLSVILCIVLICTFTLSIAYAALSAVLTIDGNAEIVASSWNIYLDNPKVSSGSVHNNLPTISGNTMTFSSSLVDPGDFYEFIVDVVNDGSIDAMIDSVVVNPVLTDSQKKYLRYEVTYQNGESISNKQLLKKKSSMPIKVRVEFRNDIPVSDLPSTATTLNHSVTLVYSQSDGTGSSVTNDGQGTVFASGDINDIGTIVTIGTEQFYVIGTENDNLKLLSMYNLYVGNMYDDVNGVVQISSPTGIQNKNAVGWFSGYSKDNPIVGTQHFSHNVYWNTSSYPSYVYNSNSLLYTYVDDYKNYLLGLGIQVFDARLPSYEEVVSLGCNPAINKCFDAPGFVYGTTYWLGSAYNSDGIWYVGKDANFHYNYINDSSNGIRPVIVLPRSSINSKTLIEFSVEGTTYQAEEGMTWSEWVDSSYDDDNFFGIQGNYIGRVWNDIDNDWMENVYTSDTLNLSTIVYPDDIIIPGHAYYGG